MPEIDWVQYDQLPVDDSFKYGTRYGVSDEMNSKQMRFSVIRFDPGERGPLHYHNEPVEEYYMVLSGTLDIAMGDEIVEATEGTVLYTPPENQHFPENTSDEPAVLLAVSAPNVDPASEDGITVVEDVD